MSKGSSKAAMNQVGIDNAYATDYNAKAGKSFDSVFPFLSSELTNPTGFGDDTVAKMKTSGGEAAAGGLGQATEGAQLLASRTGNTAAAPGIIDVASRNAMKAQADNSRSVDIANAQAKLGQQQAGASGLSSLFGGSSTDALRALGLTDESINAWTGAKHAANSDIAGFAKLGLDAGQDAFNDYEKANGK